MIAAICLVALVALAGQAQAAPSHAEVQPFWGGEIAGLKELGCLIDSAKKFAALAPEVHAHRAQIMTAAIKLGSKLTRCVAAEDKLTCAYDEFKKFVESEEVDADVRALAHKAMEIRDKLEKCIVPEEVTLLEVEPYWGGEIADIKHLGCVIEHAKKFAALVHEARGHRNQILSTVLTLGSKLTRCVSVENKVSCAKEVVESFIKSDEIDVDVKALIQKAFAIHGSFQKCIHPQMFAVDMAEVEPYWGGEIAGLKDLKCIVEHTKKFAALAPEVHAHRAQILSAVIDLGSKLTPCVSADDKLSCAKEVVENFIKSDELDADVKALAQKALEIHVSFQKCVHH